MPTDDTRIQLDSTGRVREQRGWLHGGMVSRVVRRWWDVQPMTGYPSSTVREGQWDRGVILRGATPRLAMPQYPIMYDPTDPTSWGSPEGQRKRNA